MSIRDTFVRLIGAAGLTAAVLGFSDTPPLAEAATIDHEVPAHGNFSMAAFRCWYPDDIVRIKGVAVLVPGLNHDGRTLADDATWREFARRHRFALLACFLQGSDGNQGVKGDYYQAGLGTGDAILDTLKLLAAQTKHPELEHAPFVLWGHSAGGQFNWEFACWKPERLIAFVVNKGGYYTGQATRATRRVPAVLFIGATDSKLRIRSITKLYQSNNGRGVPWALAIEPHAGHEMGRTRQFAQMFFDAVIPLRLPSAADSRVDTSALNEIKEETGWLGDLNTHEIQPASAESKTPWKDMVWLPSEALAREWQAFVTGKPFQPSAPK